MADVIAQVVNTTRPDYMKGFSDMTTRKRLRLAMLKNRGRIKNNCSGEDCRWQIKFSKPATRGYSDGQAIDYANHSAFKRVRIDWRGLYNTDSLSLMQHMINTGDNQLINLFQDKVNNVMGGLDDDFPGEMFKDGEASDRLDRPHGLETFLADDGTTGAADLIAKPSDNYGLDSLSTIPGNYGGTWTDTLSTPPNATLSNDWPHGSGSREYDFNSPILLNYSSTNWGTGSTSWESNCWRVLSQGITWLMVNGGKDGTPDLVSLDKNLFQGYKNHHETIRRINVPHKEANDLGFGNTTLNQDGVAIHCEFDIPANTGYIENLNNVEIRSLAPQLFWLLTGADRNSGMKQFMDNVDMRSLAMLMLGGFFGNVKYVPKGVGKIKSYA